MSVPSLPSKVFAVYNVLTGEWSGCEPEEAQSWREMIEAGVLNVVIYEGDVSWTEHAPRGSNPFTPPVSEVAS